MAYARFDVDSDVYVFLHVEGFLHCCSCCLNEDHDFKCTTTADMIAHLGEHARAGHDVPDDVVPALEAEAAEIDAEIVAIRDKAEAGT